jgi:hypothetical protein
MRNEVGIPDTAWACDSTMCSRPLQFPERNRSMHNAGFYPEGPSKAEDLKKLEWNTNPAAAYWLKAAFKTMLHPIVK